MHAKTKHMSFTVDDICDIPDKPYQPHHLLLPLRKFGKSSPVYRAFQVSWFNRFSWIHYDVPRDAVFCFVCCKATKEKKLKVNGLTEATFLRSGYMNWKDVTRNLGKHEQCEFHKQAVVVLSKTKDVFEMLSTKVAADKEKNRTYFLKVLSTI